MAEGAAVSRTREANVLAAYKLLSEDASFVRNIYRSACIPVGPTKTAGRSQSLQSVMTKLARPCRRLKLSYYQYEVSSVCYMLQVSSPVPGRCRHNALTPRMVFSSQSKLQHSAMPCPRAGHAQSAQQLIVGCCREIAGLIAWCAHAVVGEAACQLDCAGSYCPYRIWSVQPGGEAPHATRQHRSIKACHVLMKRQEPETRHQVPSGSESRL